MSQPSENLAAPESSALDLSKREMEADWLRLEQKKQELETVKVLHAAALARWRDRRENEWKLNYAIWAGIAAFDGVLLLHRDALFLRWRTILLIGAAAVLFHTAYLWPTIERAISEIEMQSGAEHAIRDMILDERARRCIKPEHLGGAIRRFDGRGSLKRWFWKRYGLFAPLAVTAALMTLAGYLAHHRA